MIEVHSWTTGNARKVYIMLEETGLPYRVYPVNIERGEQFAPAFLKISPNNRIPAIVDRDGPGGAPYPAFESGAILIYLAEKTGRFLPVEPRRRYDVLQWLMWQMGGVGPMFGQAGHFVKRKDDPAMAYSLERYRTEALRLCGVLDRRLGESEFVGGPDYSIADMAIYPWCQNPEKRGIAYDGFPGIRRWMEAVGNRPAVRRADEVATETRAAWTAAQPAAVETQSSGGSR